MSDYIVPAIGSLGFYNLIEPFNHPNLGVEQYSCQSVRTINDLIANQLDPFALYYEPKGLTEDDYKYGLENNVPIIGLQSSKGHWIFVPANYLLSYPNPNGVPYHVLMLGVSLGAVPVDKDFSGLHTSIKNLIHDKIGIIPEIKEVQISEVSLIPSETHDAIETARAALAVNNLSDSARVENLTGQLNTALLKIQELETYIKDKL